MGWNEEEVETKLEGEGISKSEATHLVSQKKKDKIDKKKSKKIKDILDSLVETTEEEGI
jgi:DNA-binding transcriptional regulator YhcF (GntR family)